MPEQTQTFSGVFPVNEVDIQISTNGDVASPTYAPIKDLESAGIAIETGVETWNPLDAHGWQRALATAKALTVSLSGKRCVGDPGNDYIASKALAVGRDCDSRVKITFPNADYIELPVVVSVTECGGGDSVNVAPLACDLQSNGKPNYRFASSVNEPSGT